MDKLELPHSIVDFVPGHASLQQAVSRLDTFKGKIRKQKRLLSKKYHPDVGECNLAKMKEINSIVDALLKLRIEPPRPQNVIIKFHQHGSVFTAGATTTATNGW